MTSEVETSHPLGQGLSLARRLQRSAREPSSLKGWRQSNASQGPPGSGRRMRAGQVVVELLLHPNEISTDLSELSPDISELVAHGVEADVDAVEACVHAVEPRRHLAAKGG